MANDIGETNHTFGGENTSYRKTVKSEKEITIDDVFPGCEGEKMAAKYTIGPRIKLDG